MLMYDSLSDSTPSPSLSLVLSLYLFICCYGLLSTLGIFVLHCSMWELPVAVCELLVVAFGFQLLKPGPLHWECDILATGLSGSSCLKKFVFGGRAMVGLPCCMWIFSNCSEQGYSSFWCPGRSLQWLFLLQSTGFRHMNSVVVSRRL